MAAQGQGGSIIGISSISALVGGGRQAHYTPTKAGVLSLMQSCACALGKYNIRCNALLPGTIRTQLNDEDLADPEKRAYMEGRIPLGRTGEPADLAGPAVFLASDLSRYVVSVCGPPAMAEAANLRCPERGTIARGWWFVCESSIESRRSKCEHYKILRYAKVGSSMQGDSVSMPSEGPACMLPQRFRTIRGPFAPPSARTCPGSSPPQLPSSSTPVEDPVRGRCTQANRCRT
ncbi:Glucose/ribitol dehydrogenase [Macrophomina phaseolina MS6]|uniref:Glucose/ribitol dehydrogenase n=1 Tax=Macrophomina phaseolina (strain MS6) TaxID=1126212 RepID=K2S0J5_MACPH|nr:Glucose/ribitol dehydrogenase [Macrophomina phaseolina MS6]